MGQKEAKRQDQGIIVEDSGPLILIPVKMATYIEGEDYKFFVGKQVLTPDDKAHFILTGPDKRKFLLPSGQYSHYNLIYGEMLVCRVDRINCKGEIFLEPLNPFYTEGQYYYFVVRGTDLRTDGFGREVKVAIVKDHFGNENLVEFRGNAPLPGTRMKLLVERISKGRLKLRRDTGIKRGIRMTIGEEYLFEVEKLAKGIDNCDYFVVRDPFGQRHMISKAHYESYGIKAGSKFTGKVIKYRTNGEMVIEPRNPFYNEGAILKMKVTAILKNEIMGTFTVSISDESGHSHTVEMDVSPEEDQLLCRVIMIRKGKPRLQVL